MFTVVELQDNGESVGVLAYSFTEEKAANTKYHEVLYYASAGDIPIHSAVLMSDGMFIKCDSVINSQPALISESESTSE